MKKDDSMTCAGIAKDRQVNRKSVQPLSEISGIGEVKLSDVTARIESASRRSDAKMDDMMQRMETMVHKTSGMVLQPVKTQINGTSSTINETREEGESKLGKMDERFTAVEARLHRLEDATSRTNAMHTNDDEFHRMQEDQNKRRAVAIGFHDDTTEEEVETPVTSTIVDAGMLKDKIQIAKPITHAFLQFTDSEERDMYIRSTNMQRRESRERG